MKTNKIDHICIAVRNLDEARKIWEPVLGKSGLIRTMVHANGLLEIGAHVEGLEKGRMVDIILI